MIVPFSMLVASALVRPAMPSSACSSPRAAVQMSADVPSIVVGGGRIGSLLASLGESTLLKRGDPFPESPATGPIYVTTRNDDLQGVIDMTPPHRREDLCFMQNGMLDAFLLKNDMADATQILLYLAVVKLGADPIDGITDTNPDGLTTAKGKWADAFTSRLQSGGLTCRTLVGDEYAKAMLEKHVWICAFMMTGALNGGITVGEVESQHTEQLRGLVTELCASGEKALGVTLEAGVFERLTAYGRSVHFFPTAVKEFEWRNGWFYDITNAALAAGQPDPMPLHTAGLKALSVIE